MNPFDRTFSEFRKYLEESLGLMREIVSELKEVKELLRSQNDETD